MRQNDRKGSQNRSGFDLRIRKQLRHALCLAMLLLLCGTVSAREYGEIPKAPRCFCYNGRPGEGCRIFLITETGLARILGPNREWFPQHVILNVGAMVKVDTLTAIGISLEATDESAEFYSDVYSIKPRIRRWFSHYAYVEGTVGMTIGHPDVASGYQMKQPQFTQSVSFGFGPYVALTLRHENLRFTPLKGSYYDYNHYPSEHSDSWYLGITIGGVPGLLIAPLAVFGAGLRSLRGID